MILITRCVRFVFVCFSLASASLLAQPTVTGANSAVKIDTTSKQGIEMFSGNNEAYAEMKKAAIGRPLFSVEQWDQRLFNSEELMNAQRTFSTYASELYKRSYNAGLLYKETIRLMFSDRAKEAIECVPEGKLLRNFSPDPKVSYYRKLTEAFDADFYNELKFCMGYLGFNYTDPYLWEAYVKNRVDLIRQIRAMNNASNRLAAFAVAVDIKYTLCYVGDEVQIGFLPFELSTQSNLNK